MAKVPRRDPRLEAIHDQPIHDPREVLRRVVDLMEKGKRARWNDDPEKRQQLLLLRGNAGKAHRELRDACIFACLMRQAHGHEYKFVPVKEQANPADVFMLWGDERDPKFCPI